MTELTYTMFNEFMSCPKAFYLRRIENLTLPHGDRTKEELQQQIMIDHLTEIFYSSLLEITTEKFGFRTRSELDKFINTFIKRKITSIKDYKKISPFVFSFLNWVTQDIWVTLSKEFRNNRRFIPIMVNRLIQDPESRFMARPSMIFTNDHSNVTSVIQTYESEVSNLDQISIEAAVCGKVLKSMGLNMTHMLYINYFTLDIIYKNVNASDYILLQKFVKNFRLRIEKQEFEKNRSASCQDCEFKLLCTN
ncbi:MAG: hypothetical protein ACTSW1_19130 [Candidatus Hodarchaeales archaeon]